MTVPLQCIWEAIDRSRASLWAEPDRHVAWITRDIVSLPKVVCRVKSSHRRPFYSHLAITRVSSYGQLNLLVETTLANLSWTDIDDTFVKMFDVSHGNRFFNSTLRDWRQFSFLFFFFFFIKPHGSKRVKNDSPQKTPRANQILTSGLCSCFSKNQWPSEKTREWVEPR